MPKIKIFLAISVIMLASLACNAVTRNFEPTPTFVVIREPTFPPQPSDLPVTEADVSRVELDKAYTAWAAGAAVIMDVRDTNAFTLSHIDGAINVPLAQIEANPGNLGISEEQWIITYCT